jgi:hypothetical protein
LLPGGGAGAGGGDTDILFVKIEAGHNGDRYIAGILGGFLKVVLDGRQGQYDVIRFGDTE